MQVILDHLSALIIGSVLILIFALLQVRGVQSASETTVNAMVRQATLDLSEMLEIDIRNMRTDVQTADAASRGILSGGSWTCNTTASGDTTLSFSFVTMTDPYAQVDSLDPGNAPLSVVNYLLVRDPGGASVSRQMGNVTVNHPLYRLERIVGGVVTGRTQSYITYFAVEYARRGVFNFEPIGTAGCPTDLARIRFQVQMAQEGIERIASDQTANSQLNFSRYGSTVDLLNWE
ncbi:MAG: hypothetical protein R2834_07010 [Rhodothermales bacterium]